MMKKGSTQPVINSSTTGKKVEKAIAISVQKMRSSKEFLMEGWMYIFDNICLSKYKQSRDCFRKKVIKFYKHYLPELSDFKEILRFPDFSYLPNSKNYLERVYKQKLFYDKTIKLRFENLIDENQSNNDLDSQAKNIIFVFKRIVRDLLSITYNFFFSESLILTNQLILEFCYQQLKYFEIEYFYCRMSFQINDSQFVLERIICIIRRIYHFWIDLIAEISYTEQEKKRFEEKESDFINKNENIEKRLRKFQNYHNMSRKYSFFQFKEGGIKQSMNKKKFEYDMISNEFSFEELLQQDDFMDPSLYEPIKEKHGIVTSNTIKKNQGAGSKQLRQDLKIEEIGMYYPFLKIAKASEVKEQNNQRTNLTSTLHEIPKAGNIHEKEGKEFQENVKMLIDLNIKILHEFLYSEYTDWQFYEEQYLIIIQLYSFLKEYVATQSIVKSVVFTYNQFKGMDGCNISYVGDDAIKYQLNENIKQKWNQLNPAERKYKLERSARKPWWWKTLGGDLAFELDSDEEFEQFGGENEKNLNRESQVIERSINSIIKQNNQRLLILIDTYLSDMLEGESMQNRNQFPHFYFDSMHMQKNESLLDDALAFDLSITITYQHNRFQNNVKSSQLIRSDSIQSMSTSINNLSNEDDNLSVSAKKNEKSENSEFYNQLDKSLDEEYNFEEKELDNQKEFLTGSLSTEIKSRQYILPLEYRKFTFPSPAVLNMKVMLTNFDLENVSLGGLTNTVSNGAAFNSSSAAPLLEIFIPTGNSQNQRKRVSLQQGMNNNRNQIQSTDDLVPVHIKPNIQGKDFDLNSLIVIPKIQKLSIDIQKNCYFESILPFAKQTNILQD